MKKFTVFSNRIKHKKRKVIVSAMSPESAVKKACGTPKGWHWEEWDGKGKSVMGGAIVFSENRKWLMFIQDNG